jgi:tetratricopeptide (TPR) repeat protein
MPDTTTQISTPPGNPQVAVLPFARHADSLCSPATGRMLGEQVAMLLWTLPNLNLLHHWMYSRNIRSARSVGTEMVAEYDRIARSFPWRALVTGKFRVSCSGLSMTLMLMERSHRDEPFSLRASASVTSPQTYPDADLLAPALCELLESWHPGLFQAERQLSPRLLDASSDSFELLCAGLDCLRYGSDGDDLRRAYWERARHMSPNSAYIRYMSRVHVGLASLRFAEEVLAMNPAFLPAYFPNDVDLEDRDELRRARELHLEGLRHVPFHIEAYCCLRDVCVALDDVETLLPLCRRHVARGTFAREDSTFGDTFATSAEKALEAGRVMMAERLCHEGLLLAEDPRDCARLYSQLAAVHEARAEWSEAGRLHHKVLALSRDADLRLAAARFFEEQEQYADAEHLLREVSNDTQADPDLEDDYLDARIRLARLLDLRGRGTEAAEIYRDIAMVDPDTEERYDWVFEAAQRLQGRTPRDGAG